MTVPQFRALFDLLVTGSAYLDRPDEPMRTLAALKEILPADECERLSEAILERAREEFADLEETIARWARIDAKIAELSNARRIPA